MDRTEQDRAGEPSEEDHDSRCESEWESGAMAYTPCGCAERAELRVVTLYLINQPEQGDWEWEDHCEGLAGGILNALREHRNPARTRDEPPM